MKKLSTIVVFLISVFYFISCSCESGKQNQKNSDFATRGMPLQEKDISISDSDSVTNTVPAFSDPEVQKYVEEYNAYVNEYLAAAESKDMTKLTVLGEKSQEWKTKGETIIQKLSSDPNELKKYNDYMLKLYQQMQKTVITSPR